MSENEQQLAANIKAYLAEIGRKGGRIGGKARTKRKQDSARANGHKGGRPAKDLTECDRVRT